jgi:hypothetical protein
MAATSSLPDRIYSSGVDFLNDVEISFSAGYESTKFGATPENCRLSIFSTPEKLAAWEAGRALAIKIMALGLP